MWGRPAWFLAFTLGVAGAASASDPNVLVRYGFDETLPTGPDTYRVFQNARGRVGLSSEFRVSGFSSLELRDVPGDHDFPELVAYFPETADGHLYLQLSLLVVDPEQELNVGLAGDGGYGLTANGLAVWLSTKDGWLFHTSDSIPKRLLRLEPFAWYVIVVDYDVERGRYDLGLYPEGAAAAAEFPEPLLFLRDQSNASNRPGSSVDRLSFISDAGTDLSSVTYYVDDLLLARDRPVQQRPFVAPGRRRFFVEQSLPHLEDLLASCPPPRDLAELGLSPSALAGLTEAELHAVDAAFSGPSRQFDGDLGSALEPLALWRTGCASLAAGRAAEAEAVLRRGLDLAPGAAALELGLVQASVLQGSWEAAEELLRNAAVDRADPRFVLLSALVQARQGDGTGALSWLEGRAQAGLRAAARGIGFSEDGLALAEAYDALLGAAQRLEEQRSFAEAMTSALQPGTAQSARWYELLGQSCFSLRELPEARDAFERALASSDRPQRVLLQLSDVAWLEGDREREQELREAIYGRLSSAEE